jgi:hypothetical protein
MAQSITQQIRDILVETGALEKLFELAHKNGVKDLLQHGNNIAEFIEEDIYELQEPEEEEQERDFLDEADDAYERKRDEGF